MLHSTRTTDSTDHEMPFLREASSGISPNAFHNIKQIRLEKGGCFKRITKVIGREAQSLREEEDPTADLCLSQIYQWANALDVDVTELLVNDEENDDSTYRIMRDERTRKSLIKIVAKIYDKSQGSIRAFAVTCMGTLLTIDPELSVFLPKECPEIKRTEIYPRPLRHYQPPIISDGKPQLHRLQDARCEQEVTLRKVGRHLFGNPPQISLVKEQETGRADIRISQLRQWSLVLELPIDELIHEPEEALSRVSALRANMVFLMKSVVSMIESIERGSHGPKEIVLQLYDQLVAIMPELKDTSSWRVFGQRRGLDDFGAAAKYEYPEESLFDSQFEMSEGWRSEDI